VHVWGWPCLRARDFSFDGYGRNPPCIRLRLLIELMSNWLNRKVRMKYSPKVSLIWIIELRFVVLFMDQMSIDKYLPIVESLLSRKMLTSSQESTMYPCLFPRHGTEVDGKKFHEYILKSNPVVYDEYPWIDRAQWQRRSGQLNSRHRAETGKEVSLLVKHKT